MNILLLKQKQMFKCLENYFTSLAKLFTFLAILFSAAHARLVLFAARVADMLHGVNRFVGGENKFARDVDRLGGVITPWDVDHHCNGRQRDPNLESTS